MHDEQGRNAHEDGSITALYLFIELRKLLLSLLQQLAEHVELIEALGHSNLVLGDAPCVFEVAHDFDEMLIVAHLGVNQLDVGLVFAHQRAVSIKSLSYLLCKTSHGTRVLAQRARLHQ